jgi:hypothetical protein
LQIRSKPGPNGGKIFLVTLEIEVFSVLCRHDIERMEARSSSSAVGAEVKISDTTKHTPGDDEGRYLYQGRDEKESVHSRLLSGSRGESSQLSSWVLRVEKNKLFFFSLS